ncbi:hypothetical protein N657DRAFT_623755 [Parathielavia appendiculata]|uniref:Peptidase C45 hydrolase domain-containing protein n=1 Tax=Parathielavia appendiculata TaxID=2587402 RepID=A0AAN6TWW7_9PEZI|nr:hypothetical protein N657DRAFT_623755 [Parathielavia appendiculata]
MAYSGTPGSPLPISEVNFDDLPESFPGLVLTGNPYQRGVKYGQVFAEKIRANICRHFDHPDLPSFDSCEWIIREVYIPGLVHHWPRGWNELLGMAQGCEMDVEHLVYLNARDDLAAIRYILEPPVQRPYVPLRPSHAIESTSAFFSQNKTLGRTGPILAHSWSERKRIHDGDDFMVLLEIQYLPDEQVKNMVILVEAGMISGSGMNSLGVAVTGNPLFSTEDYLPSWGTNEKYFPVTCVERFLLEWASVKDVEDILTKLDTHASKHILIANEDGDSASLELGPLTSKELDTYKPIFAHDGDFGNDAKLHTNHFCSWAYWQHRRGLLCRYRGQPSPSRLHSLGQLIKENGHCKMSARQIKFLFSDHERHPNSICQHGADNDDDLNNKTVALVMYHTSRRVVSLCKGPPCRATMMVHFAIREGAAVPASGDSDLCEADKKIVKDMAAALAAVDVEVDMLSQKLAAKRRRRNIFDSIADFKKRRRISNNTPATDAVENERRRLNKTPASDVAQDDI